MAFRFTRAGRKGILNGRLHGRVGVEEQSALQLRNRHSCRHMGQCCLEDCSDSSHFIRQCMWNAWLHAPQTANEKPRDRVHGLVSSKIPSRSRMNRRTDGRRTWRAAVARQRAVWAAALERVAADAAALLVHAPAPRRHAVPPLHAHLHARRLGSRSRSRSEIAIYCSSASKTTIYIWQVARR
jgi:hypothetical protein